MRYRDFIRNFPPLLLLVLDILIIIGVAFLVSISGIIIAVLFFGVSLTDILVGIPAVDNVNLFIWLTALQELAIFLFPAIAIAWFNSPEPFSLLKARKIPKPFLILLIVIIFFLSIPIVNFLLYFNTEHNLLGFWPDIQNAFKVQSSQLQEITQKIMSVHTPAEYLRNVLVIGLIAAVSEEFMFRGILQERFISITRSPDLGILITALIFSMFHLDYNGFLARFFLGLTLGYIFYWTRNIWLNILLHFINNFFGVTVFYYVTLTNSDISRFEQYDPTLRNLLISAISLLLFLVFMLILKKETQKPFREDEQNSNS